MINLYFRNDDVNPNSNFKHIEEIYIMIKDKFPESEIYSCINIFGKSNDKGSPYPSMKNIYNTRVYYDVDRMFDFSLLSKLHTIVSHGLFHFAHSQTNYETQKFSILSSCSLLKTKIFLPPFVDFNNKTEKICNEFQIKMIGKEKWRSLEKDRFDASYPIWLFHSWMWTPEQFYNKICQIT